MTGASAANNQDIGHSARDDEMIVTKDGKEVGRFIPKESAVSFLTDSLTGILRGNSEPNEEREKALRAKYKITD